jgi:plasmid stabilization system protein ParE
MAEITWSAEAEAWLKEIYDYIALDNEKAASKVVNGIYEKAQVLKRNPRIGHKYRIEQEGEIRILIYSHYRITYLVSKSDSITILGIFHGALNIDRFF